MDSAELLTRWTARIAMVFYALSLARRLRKDPRTPDATAAALWGVGLGFYLVHFACAFGYYLHWSHTEAVAFTALRSEQIVGFRFGGGIYFNYVFTAVWLVDALWMVAAKTSYARRPGWYDVVVQDYMAFMAFNGVVVFGPSPARWFGAAATVVLVALAIKALWRGQPRTAAATD